MGMNESYSVYSNCLFIIDCPIINVNSHYNSHEIMIINILYNPNIQIILVGIIMGIYVCIYHRI
jgi:hypothetical protein